MIVNISFVILCAGILIFLFNAPKETTSPLPHDDIHSRFHTSRAKKRQKNFASSVMIRVKKPRFQLVIRLNIAVYFVISGSKYGSEKFICFSKLSHRHHLKDSLSPKFYRVPAASIFVV